MINTPMAAQPSQLTGVQPQPRHRLGPSQGLLVTRSAIFRG